MQDLMSRFEKMFAHIAFGLRKKLEQDNSEEYTYGLLLRQGINLFSALAAEYSGMKTAALKSYLISLNETEMICNMFTRPVKEWFQGWDEYVLNKISECSFWGIGPLIYIYEKEKKYALTDECLDYLDSMEQDLSAIDEHAVFNLMKQLSQNNQDNYVHIREFIIKHPILSEYERKKLLVHFDNEPSIVELVACAYENIPDDTYCCPNCGWTLNFNGMQPECCHKDCIEAAPQKAKCSKVKPEYIYRLKKGVMRYICYPGKVELEINDFCKKINVKSELWPELDRYDIKIIFSSGICWGIDAKTYGNPHLLSQSIKQDNYFKNASIDKGFYVVPDKIVKRFDGYLKICKRVLSGNKKFKCISFSTLKSMIKKEVKQ